MLMCIGYITNRQGSQCPLRFSSSAERSAKVKDKVLRLDLPLVGMSSCSSSLVCHALSGLLAMRLRLVTSTI
jgi:hypothetical protein